ncbi:hypothetical protein AN2V17_39690 [Vallitalea sp. AN17-2]|uniref:Uncharacterized protein n=1 Tax=Vallitalea maricola TaxID=3074433 RepID=A0ACB5UQH5_9FIRM|nr:hypothetical protein AN2V17_39690 [Vallitalea sp. AN17-2]
MFRWLVKRPCLKSQTRLPWLATSHTSLLPSLVHNLKSGYTQKNHI